MEKIAERNRSGLPGGFLLRKIPEKIQEKTFFHTPANYRQVRFLRRDEAFWKNERKMKEKIKFAGPSWGYAGVKLEK